MGETLSRMLSIPAFKVGFNPVVLTTDAGSFVGDFAVALNLPALDVCPEALRTRILILKCSPDRLCIVSPSTISQEFAKMIGSFRAQRAVDLIENAPSSVPHPQSCILI